MWPHEQLTPRLLASSLPVLAVGLTARSIALSRSVCRTGTTDFFAVSGQLGTKRLPGPTTSAGQQPSFLQYGSHSERGSRAYSAIGVSEGLKVQASVFEELCRALQVKPMLRLSARAPATASDSPSADALCHLEEIVKALRHVPVVSGSKAHPSSLARRIPGRYLQGLREGADLGPLDTAVAPKTPIIVFVNAKSGGRAGEQLAQLFESVLGEGQV